jgi:D-alanyl-D-alanine carboxypeptidase
MIKRIFCALTAILIVFQLNLSNVFGEEKTSDSTNSPVIKSEYSVLMDQLTGRVIYEKNMNERAFPASLTKIMTALLILENLDMKGIYTVGNEIENVETDASDAGLVVGEKLTGQDLIWALMLPSGNDAAYTAAVNIARKKSGNASMETQEAVKYFAGMMNERAKKIGAKDSNFVNPDGYPDENHYSTAYDMALISMEALKNDFFKEVVGTYSYDLNKRSSSNSAVSNKQGIWYNRNQLINDKSKYFYKYAKGIKTGHTSLAGYCLAAYAENGDKKFVSIILKGDSEGTRCEDSIALFEYGFTNYKYQTLMKKGNIISSVLAVRKYFGDSAEINVQENGDYTGLFNNSEISAIKKSIEWNNSILLPEGSDTTQIRLSGPIKEGQAVGKIKYVLNGEVLAESELTAVSSALEGGFKSNLVGVIDFVLKYKFIVIGAVVVVVVGIIGVILAGRRFSKGM